MAEHVQQTGVDEDWRFVYEWFAGWCWEQYRGGTFVTESLNNFETQEDCIADANRHGRNGHVNAVSAKAPPALPCATVA